MHVCCPSEWDAVQGIFCFPLGPVGDPATTSRTQKAQSKRNLAEWEMKPFTHSIPIPGSTRDAFLRSDVWPTITLATLIFTPCYLPCDRNEKEANEMTRHFFEGSGVFLLSYSVSFFEEEAWPYSLFSLGQFSEDSCHMDVLHLLAELGAYTQSGL